MPTLVIIKNGTVVEKLEGDIGYEQWAKRLTKGCGVRPRWVSVDISKRQSRILAPSSSLAAAKDSISEEEYAATSQPETQAAAPTLPSDASVNDAANEGAPATYEDTTAQQIPAPPSAVLDNITASAAPIDTTSTLEPQTASAEPSTVAANETTTEGASTAPAETAPTHNPEQLQAILSERGQRLEAERLRREATEKAERIARARARREEEERAQAEAQQQSDKGKSRADGSEYARNKARVDWVQQQAKRKQEAKDEKERIMARIEADKRERKTKDEERKQAASAATASEPLPTDSSSTITPPAPTARTCALQVRLFDGSSIKTRFASDSTLATAVREWIKTTSPPGGADIPYNFRQILTPKPSRTIEISEETQTLFDVGLMPTATLVLVPVAGFTEAYSGGASSGGLIGSAYGLVSGAFGLGRSAFGYLTGYGSGVNASQRDGGIYMGGTADDQEPSNVQGARMAGADTAPGGSRVRVKTMAEQRAENEKKGAEFYNGNSLGTEGRPRDD